MRLCRAIVESSPQHKVIVVSAPGKYGIYDSKVTDDLIKVARGDTGLDRIIRRFDDIASQLLTPEQYQHYQAILYHTQNAIRNHLDDYNFVVSRGEYLSAQLFALYLGYRFVDAQDILVINHDATINLDATRRQIRQHKLKRHLPFVIGGFYGQRDGHTALFTRGGSDYTGAIMAVLLHAKIYKNYTDTNGIQTADPRLVYDTQTITCLDFDSLDILTHNGAGIIHENVAALLAAYRVPLRVDNTFAPDQAYTEVHSLRCRNCQPHYFCITHRDNQIILVQKTHSSPTTVQKINTTPATLVSDIQKLHLAMLKNL